jgi:hypothetical protein
MSCFICERTELEVMLMKVPVETMYEDKVLQIVGNVIESEFICLPCIGFQFDLLTRSEAQ